MNNRRRFLFGAAALLAAPAIARASSLMPVSDWSRLPLYWGDGVHDDTPYIQAALDKLAPGHNMTFVARPHYTLTPLDFSRCTYNVIDLRDCFEETVLWKENIGRANYINLTWTPTGIFASPSAVVYSDPPLS